MDADTTKGVLWLAAILGGLVLLAVWGYVHGEKTKRRAKELEATRHAEAAAFFARVNAAKAFESIETHLILDKGEEAVLSDPAVLYETRSVRVAGGAGTSIRGIHIGGGASESHDRLRRIDAGTLVLTSKRLVFDGSVENRSLKLESILSVEELLDGIEVSTDRRSKSLIFQVPNPLIWGKSLRAVAQESRGTD